MYKKGHNSKNNNNNNNKNNKFTNGIKKITIILILAMIPARISTTKITTLMTKRIQTESLAI